jgi:hypothetical protein
LIEEITMTEIKKINGRMTKREVVRGMSRRAFSGESSEVYSIGYVARRIDLTVPQAKNFLRSLNRMGIVEVAFSKRSVMFV